MNVTIRRSAVLEVDKDKPGDRLHGQYRQDKRALRGARASARGERDEDWQAQGDQEDEHGNSGAITLSSLPRGYWATLFNLEVVKARNRPIEPPKKPASAPFFLATVHREGEVAPSFPDVGSLAAAAAVEKGKLKTGAAAAAESGQSATPLLGVDDVPDLPLGGDAWSDDDDDNEEDEEGGGGGKEDTAVVVRGKRKLGCRGEEDDGAPDVPPAAAAAAAPGKAASKSRILKQIKTSAKRGGKGPSRCRLADLLLECKEEDEVRMDDEEEEDEGVEGRRRFGAVMSYLKKLPPPMVDVDMSLLCQGEWDEEGVQLVRLALEFLLEELRCACIYFCVVFVPCTLRRMWDTLAVWDWLCLEAVATDSRCWRVFCQSFILLSGLSSRFMNGGLWVYPLSFVECTLRVGGVVVLRDETLAHLHGLYDTTVFFHSTESPTSFVDTGISYRLANGVFSLHRYHKCGWNAPIDSVEWNSSAR